VKHYPSPIDQQTPVKFSTLRFLWFLFTEALVGLIFIGAGVGAVIIIAEVLDWLGVVTI
jgi:hypothetical protein